MTQITHTAPRSFAPLSFAELNTVQLQFTVCEHPRYAQVDHMMLNSEAVILGVLDDTTYRKGFRKVARCACCGAFTAVSDLMVSGVLCDDRR